jgi:hypothetical protein
VSPTATVSSAHGSRLNVIDEFTDLLEVEAMEVSYISIEIS